MFKLRVTREQITWECHQLLSSCNMVTFIGNKPSRECATAIAEEWSLLRICDVQLVVSQIKLVMVILRRPNNSNHQVYATRQTPLLLKCRGSVHTYSFMTMQVFITLKLPVAELARGYINLGTHC